MRQRVEQIFAILLLDQVTGRGAEQADDLEMLLVAELFGALDQDACAFAVLLGDEGSKLLDQALGLGDVEPREFQIQTYVLVGSFPSIETISPFSATGR